MQTNDLGQIIQNNMLQHTFAVSDDLLAVVPVLQGHIYDGHGATGPLVLIGFLAEKPIYRTTHTVAHRKDAFLKLENLLVNFFFCRYGKRRCLPHTLATIFS